MSKFRFHLLHGSESMILVRDWELKMKRDYPKYGFDSPFWNFPGAEEDRERVLARLRGEKIEVEPNYAERVVKRNIDMLLQTKLSGPQKRGGAVWIMDRSNSMGSDMAVAYANFLGLSPLVAICTNGYERHPWVSPHVDHVVTSYKEFEERIDEFIEKSFGENKRLNETMAWMDSIFGMNRYLKLEEPLTLYLAQPSLSYPGVRRWELDFRKMTKRVKFRNPYYSMGGGGDRAILRAERLGQKIVLPENFGNKIVAKDVRLIKISHGMYAKLDRNYTIGEDMEFFYECLVGGSPIISECTNRMENHPYVVFHNDHIYTTPEGFRSEFEGIVDEKMSGKESRRVARHLEWLKEIRKRSCSRAS